MSKPGKIFKMESGTNCQQTKVATPVDLWKKNKNRYVITADKGETPVPGEEIVHLHIHS